MIERFKLTARAEKRKKDESQDNRLIDEPNQEIDIIILLGPYVTEGPKSFPAENKQLEKRASFPN